MRTGVEKANHTDTPITAEQAIAKGRDAVADALTYLTSSRVQNFYARVINLMDRIAVPGFKTMGVSLQRGRYIFVYDPIFAATVSYEELCATCEHEVLHIILEHIPRTLLMRKTFSNKQDLMVFDMLSNLAVDLADNELLARSWPKIKDTENKPLGYWVVPEEYTPPLPVDMAYEDYHRLLLDMANKRLNTPMTKLYQMAKQILKQQSDALKEALKGEKSEDGADGGGGEEKENEDNQQGQGPGSGSGENQEQSQDSGSGQGQGQGQPGSGNGGGNGGGGSGEEEQEQEVDLDALQKEIENLDPTDQKMLEMLVKSMQSHMGWQEGNVDESDVHKVMENGKELIKQTIQNHNKSRGTLPAHLMELIRKMLTPPAVPWTALLHNIVQRTMQTKKMRGMSRPSKKLAATQLFIRKKQEEEDPVYTRLPAARRLPVFPGIRLDKKFTIVYAVDTSGSMSTAELQMGLSELQHIQKSDSEVDICVIYADMTIGKEYWIDQSGEIDPGMTGRGGTDFDPVFEYVAQMMRRSDKVPDILIYCTDGYAPPPQTRLPIPTVWLLTPRGQPVMADSGHITIYMKDYQLEDAHVDDY